ncbi:MAG TPA: hypothetical protein VK989_06080 [Polyangia bacterium]|nr:hypothetical protein [Polyangia bacterium]
MVRSRGLGAFGIWVAVVSGLFGVSGCHGAAAGGVGGDAAVDAPEVSEKLPPPDANCPLDAAGGGGVCPLNFCGEPKSVAALGTGTAQLGADSICTSGRVCVPDGPSASGDALLLRCVAPLALAAPYGTPCTKGAGTAKRCVDDSLCITSADMPGQPFCSALCRADQDCPTSSYCLEYKSQTLPNGSYVNVGYCTPKAKIAATFCANEAACAAGQGCVVYGARTNLVVCKTLGGTKSLGDACTGAGDCRSGDCFTRDFNLYGLGNRAYCSGLCAQNSDCSPDQRCKSVVLANNGTPFDPTDDTVVGYCQSLYTSTPDAACHADTDCTTAGADTCSTKYGLCYKAGAATGAACTGDPGCDLGATCSKGVDFPGGYCQAIGCAVGAAAGSVDACADTGSVCSQRSADVPLHACYEGCAASGDCARLQQKYQCEAPMTGTMGASVPVSICLFNQGS